MCDADFPAANDKLTPDASVADSSSDAAIAAGLAHNCETLSGAVRFRAQSLPTQNITCQVLLFGPYQGNGNSSGNVTGQGLTDEEKKIILALFGSLVGNNTAAKLQYDRLKRAWNLDSSTDESSSAVLGSAVLGSAILGRS